MHKIYKLKMVVLEDFVYLYFYKLKINAAYTNNHIYIMPNNPNPSGAP